MKTDDTNIELLNYIYQGAEMGVIGIKDIEEKTEDERFLKVVESQKEEYESICKEAIRIFLKYGKDEKSLGTLPKVSSYLMTMFKTLTDKSTANLAKMMIEGSNKGIIEITEKLNNYDNSDSEQKKLAEKLLQTEKKNLEELKPFL